MAVIRLTFRRGWVTTLMLLSCIQLFPVSLTAQTADSIPDVEVFRLSGPGTEPQISQTADSMDFHLLLTGGVMLNDPEVKYLMVEGEKYLMTYIREDSGIFRLDLPNCGTDSFYILTFMNAQKEVLAVYPLSIKEFQLHSLSRGTVISMPAVCVVQEKPKIGWDGPGGGWQGCGGIGWYLYGELNRSPGRMLPLVELKNPQRPVLKMRVGYHPRVEYGTPEVPGVDLHLKLDDIRE